jgi:hypothetical protein
VAKVDRAVGDGENGDRSSGQGIATMTAAQVDQVCEVIMSVRNRWRRADGAHPGRKQRNCAIRSNGSKIAILDHVKALTTSVERGRSISRAE